MFPALASVMVVMCGEQRNSNFYNMSQLYTEEQITDIKDRETRALDFLKMVELTPAAILTKVNVGNDIFADKVQPFLQDLKYTKKDEVEKDEVEPTPNDAVAKIA